MSLRTDTFDLAGLRLTAGEGRRLELHVAIDPFELGGESYPRRSRRSIPVRLDVSRTTGEASPAAAVRRAARGPCMRCLEPAAPSFDIDAREVSQPGDGEELESPYVEHGRARPARVGARRAGAGAARRAALPRGLRRACARCAASTSTGPARITATSARPIPVGQAVRAALRLAVRHPAGAGYTARHGRPEAEAVSRPHLSAPLPAQAHPPTTTYARSATARGCPTASAHLRLLQGARGHRRERRRTARLTPRPMITVAVDAGGADLGPAEVAAGAARPPSAGSGCCCSAPPSEIGPVGEGVEVVDAPVSIAKAADPAFAVAHDAGGVDRSGRSGRRRRSRPGARLGRLDRVGAGRRRCSTSSATAGSTGRPWRCRSRSPAPRRSCCWTWAPT